MVNHWNSRWTEICKERNRFFFQKKLLFIYLHITYNEIFTVLAQRLNFFFLLQEKKNGNYLCSCRHHFDTSVMSIITNSTKHFLQPCLYFFILRFRNHHIYIITPTHKKKKKLKWGLKQKYSNLIKKILTPFIHHKKNCLLTLKDL